MVSSSATPGSERVQSSHENLKEQEFKSLEKYQKDVVATIDEYKAVLETLMKLTGGNIIGCLQMPPMLITDYSQSIADHNVRSYVLADARAIKGLLCTAMNAATKGLEELYWNAEGLRDVCRVMNDSRLNELDKLFDEKKKYASQAEAREKKVEKMDQDMGPLQGKMQELMKKYEGGTGASPSETSSSGTTSTLQNSYKTLLLKAQEETICLLQSQFNIIRSQLDLFYPSLVFSTDTAAKRDYNLTSELKQRFDNLCGNPAQYNLAKAMIDQLSSGVEGIRLEYQDTFQGELYKQRELSKGVKNDDESKKFEARGKVVQVDIQLYDLMVAAAKDKIQRYNCEVSKIATAKDPRVKVKTLEMFKNADEKAKKTLIGEMITVERKRYELLDACGSCAKCEKCEKEGAKPSDEFLRKKMEELIVGKDTWNDGSEKEI